MKYPLSKEDKRIRNKVEVIVLAFYIFGLCLSALTKQPGFILLTALSVPFCHIKKVKECLLS